ncbi:cytokine receptor common subunit gamma-like [Conger conger]|uniref:cytokine receptor common subunit gamma-like n=1 Tax=Conger conger TaxID=82655 RepID=UPI002A5A765A|nr:cytokine receptor common subunit gamma-like [Conger conger]
MHTDRAALPHASKGPLTPFKMLVGFVLVLFSLGYASCSFPKVSCTIMNLKYIDCIWNENGIPEFNYTFYSKWQKKEMSNCTTYLQEGEHTVGCRLNYTKGEKFEKLSTYLSFDNRSSETLHDLQNRVKLMPPHNLSVKMQGSSELRLDWNISAENKCMESEVSYRKDIDTKDTMTGALPSMFFILPFPSKVNRYTFQVRIRVKDSCLQSNWSAWSTPVYWGQTKQVNRTEASNGNWLVYMLPIMGCVVVVTVVLLAFQNERLRVILIPIVPNPSKTLDDLLYTHDGKVEDWLHISKDFVEGFKPNFSEPACPVREYNLIPQMSINGSMSSLPVLSDESDCLSTSCSTSVSSISCPPGDTPPGLV